GLVSAAGDRFVSLIRRSGLSRSPKTGLPTRLVSYSTSDVQMRFLWRRHVRAPLHSGAMAGWRVGPSARAHDRILKVARTIADLEQAEAVTAQRVKERAGTICIVSTGFSSPGWQEHFGRGGPAYFV